MNELSGKRKELSDADIVMLGFCPHCHCSDSEVTSTRKVESSTVRRIHGVSTRVKITKIIRYRRCSHCRRNFRTTEESRLS